MANILSVTDFNPNAFSSHEIAKRIANRARVKRLQLNLSQQALANRSGVSLGSLKRFESEYEISLRHMLALALALQSTEEFLNLFPESEYNSIDDIIKQNKVKKRKRGRTNV